MISISFNSLFTFSDRAESSAILIIKPPSSLPFTKEKEIVLYLNLEEKNNLK